MTTIRDAARTALRMVAPPRFLQRVGLSTLSLSEEARSELVVQRVKELARGSGSILVGPWITEVGFELLYWIPFLRWIRSLDLIDPARFVVVSRGGVAPWYADISTRYVEVLDFFSPDEFRVGNEERAAEQGGGFKHHRLTPLDERILARVRAHLGISQADVLHPSLMFQLFTPFWLQRAPIRFVERHLRFAHLPPLEASVAHGDLGNDFIAAKFYYSASFPETAENRALVASVLRALTTSSDVVLLSTGLRLDDHIEYDAPFMERVHTLDSTLSPSENLLVQTSVVARARAFVGTYGGFSYLAPFYGVSSIALFSDPMRFLPQHLDLAVRTFHRLGGASLTPLAASSFPALSAVLENVPSRPGTVVGRSA